MLPVLACFYIGVQGPVSKNELVEVLPRTTQMEPLGGLLWVPPEVSSIAMASFPAHSSLRVGAGA